MQRGGAVREKTASRLTRNNKVANRPGPLRNHNLSTAQAMGRGSARR